jgi:hypothetical protein
VKKAWRMRASVLSEAACSIGYRPDETYFMNMILSKNRFVIWRGLINGSPNSGMDAPPNARYEGQSGQSPRTSADDRF